MEWKVLPHEPLRPLGDDVWMVDGALDGMPLRRTMTVARTPDGRLLLHSAIAMDDAGMAALEALGTPTWMVVPSAFHRMDAPRYKARYPGLQVIGPGGARKAIEKRLPMDARYDTVELPAPLRLEHLDGLKGREGVLHVSGSDGTTLVFNDALFNLSHGKGLFWWVYGRLMGNAGRPRVTTVARTFIVSKRALYRAHLERLADIPDLRCVVPGHGHPVLEGAADMLRAVAAEL